MLTTDEINDRLSTDQPFTETELGEETDAQVKTTMLDHNTALVAKEPVGDEVNAQTPPSANPATEHPLLTVSRDAAVALTDTLPADHATGNFLHRFYNELAALPRAALDKIEAEFKKL
jgi:hypothetical protein